MGLSGGAIAGIVIGCVAFVVLKTACKLFVLHRGCILPSQASRRADAQCENTEEILCCRHVLQL